jgi:glycosyltransferase involved in cell wall biosynthesis
MMALSDGIVDEHVRPRTLAGATVLQIAPTMHQGRTAHVTLNVAHALMRAGARAIVASEGGPLADVLKGFGGEWLAYPDTTFNLFKLKRNVDRLAELMEREQIDVVHARSAGAAWSAVPALERAGARFVTELLDLPYAHMAFGRFHLRAISSGDRVIVHSEYDARPMVERYRVPPENVKVIPRGIDTNMFDPAAVPPARAAALRQAWGVPSGARVVLVPGRVAPWNGQITLVEAARILSENGMRGVTFVFAGDDRRHPRYVRSILNQAQSAGVQALFRMVGHCTDMPAAFFAADFIVVPCIKPPVTGHMVAEAQAMARPVIASSVGALPENLLAPPRVAEEFRTGWVVAPDDASSLARALGAALSLDNNAYRALCVRARQSATFLFSPESVITATLEVYNSLLQAET